MTPSEVSAYLDALRGGNCMSATLILPGGVTISAVFGPDMGDVPKLGKDIPEPAPGDWKLGSYGADQ